MREGATVALNLTPILKERTPKVYYILVYLFESEAVFAFVTFIPILPAQGALEDELPRNTKF